EADFLQQKLAELTGTNLSIEEGQGSGEEAIFLRSGALEVAGISREAYTLDIDEKGIEIMGSDAAGVFYGIQSLIALLPTEIYLEDATSPNWPHAHIEDAPRF